MNSNSGSVVAFNAAEKRRKLFMDACESGCTIQQALRAADVSDAAYRQWRRRYPAFASTIDSVRASARNREQMPVNPHAATGFAQFREKYFGNYSPPFQIQVIDELERLQPGQILLVLFAPLHGKTTLYEDYSGYKFAYDKSWMTTVGMNKVDHSKKVLGRVMGRMDPEAGFHDYRRDFGPFRETGPGKRKQIWSATHFNVLGKPPGNDRDYSMQAVGISSSLASVRTKHLHGDDLQDKNTQGQTDQIEDRVRQDWLSRPADEGITTVFGNRVIDDDFYARLLDDDELRAPRSNGRGPLLRVIQLPCIIKDDKGHDAPLWPGRWTLDALEDMMVKVKEPAWSRNWLQRPDLVRKNRHFVAEDIKPCYNPLRNLGPIPGGICWIGLDPAIGGVNCVLAADVGTGKIKVTGIREKEGLESNEQIMEELEAEVVHQLAHGAIVPRVIIESKNFQAGLARDERLMRMAQKYHFEIYEHLTGINKWDSDIGVLSMLFTFKAKEFDLPWGEDPVTREEISILTNQFYAFRTSADEMMGNRRFRGNVLRQDRVMALWFIWIHWRLNFHVTTSDDGGWHTDARNFGLSPTSPNLIIPVGAQL